LWKNEHYKNFVSVDQFEADPNSHNCRQQEQNVGVTKKILLMLP